MTSTTKHGIELLHDPSLNKSTAFTEAEKQALGLIGLVPDVTETEELQLQRVMMQLSKKDTDLDRYIFLMNLLDHNETLFYRTVMSDPARFLPVVYDPTIGEACLKFGHIYRQARGMYLSITRRGKVKEILKNWPQKDVRFICVTDGGRILGLGDLGANGAGIPIGKLQLYTACAGVPPQYLLPMYLDAGTNNEQYLHDPLYLGMRKTRPATADLYSFVDEFVEAVQEVFPKCCIHFEDWTGTDAVHLLERYRDKYCVYNDDVQGTAGITLAGMINAAKIKGTKLKDEKYLFLGAGSAGIGLANLLCSALVAQGMTLKEAQARVYMFDINGLLEASRKDLVDFQKPYAHQHAPTRDFVAAIESIKPTTIIGVLDLKDAIHVGHSTGGGEVARYIGRHGSKRVAKAVLIGAVPPLMLKTPANPGGLSIEVFDQIRAGVLNDRSQFFKDLSAPFYGANRPGAKVSQGLRDSFWLQGMWCGHKAAYDCIKAFSETDFTEDLKKIDVPTLVLHGDDDQIVPIADSALLSAKLVKGATLKVIPGAPHGMCSTLKQQINEELIGFFKAGAAAVSA